MPNSLSGSNPGGNLSFMHLLGLVAASLVVGGFVYAGAHALVVAGQVARWAHHPALDIVMPLVAAAVVAFLVLRTLVRRPSVGGLSWGGGWFGRRRDWDDGYGNYGYSTLGQQVVGDVVADVVSAAIDAATD